VAAAAIERAIEGVSDEEREIDMVGVSNVLGNIESSPARTCPLTKVVASTIATTPTFQRILSTVMPFG
jgi:hypothetical protein